MVALNVQCSMFNGESAFKFAAAAIVAAATGCFGFLGHDVGCNVLHLLSLLVRANCFEYLMPTVAPSVHESISGVSMSSVAT